MVHHVISMVIDKGKRVKYVLTRQQDRKLIRDINVYRKTSDPLAASGKDVKKHTSAYNVGRQTKMSHGR